MDLLISGISGLAGGALSLVVVGVFPRVLGKALLMRLQHSYDKKLGGHKQAYEKELARLEGHIEARTADTTVAASLMAGNRAIRKQKEIETLEEMWNTIQELVLQFEGVLAYEDAVTPEQFDRCIKTSGEGTDEDQTIFRGSSAIRCGLERSLKCSGYKRDTLC